MRTIATKNDWHIEKMPKRNKTFILEREFSNDEIENLKYGNIPKEMEDKWFWYVEDDKLYAHRSWTGYCIYIIKFDFETNKHTVTVNRNKKQYSNTNTKEDLERLNNLLDWWTASHYDYYNQWIEETVDAITKSK